MDQTSTSTSGGSGRRERVPGGFAIPSMPGLYEGAGVVPWPGSHFLAVCVHGVAMRARHVFYGGGGRTNETAGLKNKTL